MHGLEIVRAFFELIHAVVLLGRKVVPVYHHGTDGILTARMGVIEEFDPMDRSGEDSLEFPIEIFDVGFLSGDDGLVLTKQFGTVGPGLFQKLILVSPADGLTFKGIFQLIVQF